MKSTIMLAAVGMMAAGAAFADPIEGMWKTQPDDGVYYHVNMQKCGSSFCGKFVNRFEDGQDTGGSMIGKNAVFDMKPSGSGTYKGKAWKPSNDKTYAGKGQLNGDQLTMKGCVLGGIICLSQKWTRLN